MLRKSLTSSSSRAPFLLAFLSLALTLPLLAFPACAPNGSPSQLGTGGANATGGATASGGATSTGGATTTGSGGATGGASATAGSTTTGSGGATATGSGGATATAGRAAGGGATATGGATAAPLLDQTGNPLSGIVNTYTGWLSMASGDAAKLTADRALADNIVTWQMPHGGWFKHDKSVYAAPWNGTAARADWTGANGVELGTIDNNATITEIMFLADVYRRSMDAKYRDAARKGLDFLLMMPVSTGGFPQVYPARTGTSYSNYVTFNDDAMVRALGMLDMAKAKKAPLTGDIFTADQLTRVSVAIAKAVDYIVKSQIVPRSTKTVWCAQHDPTTYVARAARSYELPSKSGKESIGVIAFLLSQPQTPEVKTAAQAAIAWFKSDEVKVANTAYVSRPSGNTDDNYNPIQARSGSTLWYRFYDLDQDRAFFSGRLPTDDPPGVGKKYDVMEIEPERRYGYQWGGSYGTGLFTYTDRVGY
jgi:PelA/Pel-15E family pectate lyase